jgi:uncharacterized coiled-coil protein SlyX
MTSNLAPFNSSNHTIAETTTAASGSAPSAVSVITEDFVSTAVKTHMSGLEATRNAQANDFLERLRTLEDTIADINSTVDNISSKLAASVLKLLTAPTGVLTIQANKLDSQHKTINRLFSAITSLTDDVKRLGNATATLTSSRTPPDSPPNGSPAKKQCTEAGGAAPEDNPMRLE